MFVTSFEFERVFRGTQDESGHRQRFSVGLQFLVFAIVTSLLALVLYAGATGHRSDDVAGDFVPERLQGIDPLVTPIVVCVCTFVARSEYTLYTLLSFSLEGRLNRILVTFCTVAVSLVCSVAVEFFIVQSIGSNLSLYWSKNIGVCMAIYMRSGVNDLQKWMTSKGD